jgi:hypothetical protein
VNNILIILVVLVAIGVIWGVVSQFLDDGASQISLDRFTLDLKIQSAHIDYETGIATVRVVRNSGEGDLAEIKFIVEDDRGSDVFTREVVDFQQLASRTFTLNLNDAEFLNLTKIHRISIAPVYIDARGQASLGNAADSVGKLNDGVEGDGDGGEPLGEGETPTCSIDTDCAHLESWDSNGICDADGTAIEKFFYGYDCPAGECLPRQAVKLFNQSCAQGTHCSGYPALCVPDEPQTCETEADCSGVDGPIPNTRTCSLDETQVLEDYIDFTCSGTCSDVTTQVLVETCADLGVEFKCVQGECLEEVECTTNPNCWEDNQGYPDGTVCNATGSCVDEVVLGMGNVFTAWPTGMGEYIDSYELPIDKDDSNITTGMYIVFPESAKQKTCLRIKGYYTPSFPEGISYLQFVESPTNVSNGDAFQVWETSWVCTLPEYNY